MLWAAWVAEYLHVSVKALLPAAGVWSKLKFCKLVPVKTE